jgi:hypothetical protein
LHVTFFDRTRCTQLAPLSQTRQRDGHGRLHKQLLQLQRQRHTALLFSLAARDVLRSYTQLALVSLDESRSVDSCILTTKICGCCQTPT